MQGRRGNVKIDISDELVAGATCELRKGEPLEGLPALGAFLGMAGGRVRVEPVESPSSANVMAPVDVALSQATGEKTPLSPSVLPPSTSAIPKGQQHVGWTRVTPAKPLAAPKIESTPRFERAGAKPCSAARPYHLAASSWERGTPRPS